MPSTMPSVTKDGKGSRAAARQAVADKGFREQGRKRPDIERD